MRNTGRIMAGLTAGLMLCAGVAVSARAGEPQAVTYQASQANIANPERGFYKHTETHYRADGSGYTPLAAATLDGYRGVYLAGSTVVASKRPPRKQGH